MTADTPALTQQFNYCGGEGSVGRGCLANHWRGIEGSPVLVLYFSIYMLVFLRFDSACTGCASFVWLHFVPL